MNLKNSLYLISIVNFIEGILGLFYGEVYVRHWHKVSNIESLLWVFSAIFIYFLAKRIKQKIEYSKCPKCKETYTYSTLEKGMCPKCDIKTIDFEKYFEKFPDER
ncbi:MAG: hypothetical protein ACNI25_12215 [Halarcobacter sp.]